jgi:flagellin-like protein
MNYRKFKKNAKALSPVVASIILIAVTVAVSVVVAAWMGGMTIGLMGSAEQVSITNIAFMPNSGADVIQVLVQNAGGTSATISSAFVNGVAVPNTSWASNPNTTPAYTLVKSSQMTLNLTLSAGYLQSGASYTVKLITAKGTSVVNTATYNP